MQTIGTELGAPLHDGRWWCIIFDVLQFRPDTIMPSRLGCLCVARAVCAWYQLCVKVVFSLGFASVAVIGCCALS